MPGLIVPFTLFTLLYLFLGIIVGWMLYSQIIRSPVSQDWSRRYTPGAKTGAQG
jgi:cytochrome bd-type quinol oxidase subunit 1